MAEEEKRILAHKRAGIDSIGNDRITERQNTATDEFQSSRAIRHRNKILKEEAEERKRSGWYGESRRHSEAALKGRGGRVAPMERNVNKVLRIDQLPKYLQFVSDSQDVKAIKEHLGRAEEYDAFFVRGMDGDYDEIWGITGILPYSSRLADRVL